MMVPGSLFASLFEVVNCGGQHKFVELAVHTRGDIGDKSTLDGQKAVSTIQSYPYNSLTDQTLGALSYGTNSR